MPKTPTLSRVNSRSSLWRTWSPMLDPLANYDKSRHHYPWLVGNDEHGPLDTTLRRATPLPSLIEIPDNTHRPDRGQDSCDSDRDLENSDPEPLLEITENDPNLVSPRPTQCRIARLTSLFLKVTWDGPSDPMNPHNWTRKKKWVSTVLVSCFTFISPVSSTMLAPALPDLAAEFNITSDFETYLIMSIFLLAYAIGPFVLAPLSEMYGRVVVLQSANMIYLIFNTVCGFSQSKNQILVFRFLSGLGGSAPQAV